MINPKVFLTIAGLILAASGGAWLHATMVDRARAAGCAEDISNSKVDRCPVEVREAFNKLELGKATQAVDQRDKAIVQQGRDYASDLAQLETQYADIQALLQAERTTACAQSPAMELLRQQLCDGCE